jgi:hypothetical protein
MFHIRQQRPDEMSDENITHVKRESVYVEGELGFEEGRWRRDNPYASSSPTLTQVWWNGWDHGRRIKQKRSPLDERDSTIQPVGDL